MQMKNRVQDFEQKVAVYNVCDTFITYHHSATFRNWSQNYNGMK